MKLIICKDYQEMSEYASRLIAARLRLFPRTVLGLATGSTPIGTYDELARMYEDEGLDFSLVRTINLDEYVGLGPDHEQSYHYFMREKLFDRIHLKEEASAIPDGMAEDPQEEARKFEAMIEDQGGIDLQILGVGPNGHIGFNEPADHFTAESHCVKLTEDTINANQRFFEKREDVPREAITMGIGQIMKARKVLLLVNGAHKANTLREAVLGPITPQVPVTVLRLHPDCTVICDADAAASLEAGEY